LETEETAHSYRRGFEPETNPEPPGKHWPRPENLTAILITHEHSDHMQGLGAISRKLRVPVYCNRPTQEAIEFQIRVENRLPAFTTRNSFELGDIRVDHF